MQDLLEKLMANYRQDILDLEEHFNLAEEFLELLKQETTKTASQKRNEFFKFLMEQQEDIIKKTEEEAPPETSYLIEKQLNRFSEKRSLQFAILRKREEESADLRKRILKLSGIKDFSMQNLQEIFEKSKLAEMSELSRRLRETMSKLLDLDQKLMELIKTEITSVKSELYRMQAGAQSKKVYQSQVFQEAKFIDKMK